MPSVIKRLISFFAYNLCLDHRIDLIRPRFSSRHRLAREMPASICRVSLSLYKSRESSEFLVTELALLKAGPLEVEMSSLIWSACSLFLSYAVAGFDVIIAPHHSI